MFVVIYPHYHPSRLRVPQWRPHVTEGKVYGTYEQGQRKSGEPKPAQTSVATKGYIHLHFLRRQTAVTTTTWCGDFWIRLYQTSDRRHKARFFGQVFTFAWCVIQIRKKKSLVHMLRKYPE